MGTRILSLDKAENSIMQTITIAVSMILITAGIVTVPALIVNARDNNAHLDLGSIAYAQEALFLSSGVYFSIGADGQPDEAELPASISYDLSGGTTDHIALICEAPNHAYLLRATSSAGTLFYRASTASVTSKDINDLVIPQCIEDQIALYDASNPEPFYPVPESPSADPDPTPEPEPEPTTAPDPDPEPEPEPTTPTGGQLITVLPSTASVEYSVISNSYNVEQVYLSNVRLTNTAASREDWEIRINKSGSPLNYFDDVTGINPEHGQVTCTDEGAYYSCRNNASGPWGNGIGGGNGFTFGIALNVVLSEVDNVSVAQANPSGGAWYATQSVTVSTTYPVFGFWETVIDFSALNNLAGNTNRLCINNSNVSIESLGNDRYRVYGNNTYYTIKEGNSRTFEAARNNGGGGGSSCASD